MNHLFTLCWIELVPRVMDIHRFWAISVRCRNRHFFLRGAAGFACWAPPPPAPAWWPAAAHQLSREPRGPGHPPACQQRTVLKLSSFSFKIPTPGLVCSAASDQKLLCGSKKTSQKNLFKKKKISVKFTIRQLPQRLLHPCAPASPQSRSSQCSSNVAFQRAWPGFANAKKVYFDVDCSVLFVLVYIVTSTAAGVSHGIKLECAQSCPSVQLLSVTLCLLTLPQPWRKAV